MFSVEISTSDESAALAESMKKMREWLDRYQLEPTLFRYSTIPPAVVFRVAQSNCLGDSYLRRDSPLAGCR